MEYARRSLIARDLGRVARGGSEKGRYLCHHDIKLLHGMTSIRYSAKDFICKLHYVVVIGLGYMYLVYKCQLPVPEVQEKFYSNS